MTTKEDTLPLLIVDTREQTPLPFANLQAERGTLTSGDYSVKGLEGRFAVERKTVADIIGSLTGERERFERECHRLRGYDFARLLIVGQPGDIALHLGRRKTSAKAIQGSLGTLEARYRLPVVWEPTPEAAALRVEKWAWWYYREALLPFRRLTTPDFASQPQHLTPTKP